jgi:hypothetical protein
MKFLREPLVHFLLLGAGLFVVFSLLNKETREVPALGLDRDDTVIRRRLRQKLEFVSDDLTAQLKPTDDELRTYLANHVDAFGVEPRFTFSHVYFNPDRRGDDLERDVQRLLSELHQAGGHADVTTLGDSFLLEQDFKAAPRSEVARIFGKSFASQLSHVEPGTWQEPVPIYTMGSIAAFWFVGRFVAMF